MKMDPNPNGESGVVEALGSLDLGVVTTTSTTTGRLKPQSSSPDLAISPPLVTVMELPTPPFSPEPPTNRFPRPSAGQPPPASPTTSDTFPFFSLLPAELRLKIWHASFLPRPVELHASRTHYAADDQLYNGAPRWQSSSLNPAALSVSVEARAAALSHYTVALPLVPPLAPGQIFDRPGNLLRSGRGGRVLYLAPAYDTLALLGDIHYSRLMQLLEWFRARDAAQHAIRPRAGGGKGVRRLAMSVTQWAHEVGGRTLRAFARSVFEDLDEFVLFMYNKSDPPQGWTGGRCVLQDASPQDDHYRRFLVRSGKQFRDGDGWMKVGGRPMKVVDIEFLDGW